MVEFFHRRSRGYVDVFNGENLGGRLASLDEGIFNHSDVGGACSVVGRRGDGSTENTFLQVFLYEYPCC